MFECSGFKGDSGVPTDGFGAQSQSSHREMRAERALLNRSEFDVEMGTTHELPPDREAFAPGGRTAIASLGALLGGEWVL